jgi:hypothetical protein
MLPTNDKFAKVFSNARKYQLSWEFKEIEQQCHVEVLRGETNGLKNIPAFECPKSGLRAGGQVSLRNKLAHYGAFILE